MPCGDAFQLSLTQVLCTSHTGSVPERWNRWKTCGCDRCLASRRFKVAELPAGYRAHMAKGGIKPPHSGFIAPPLAATGRDGSDWRALDPSDEVRRLSCPAASERMLRSCSSVGLGRHQRRG